MSYIYLQTDYSLCKSLSLWKNVRFSSVPFGEMVTNVIFEEVKSTFYSMTYDYAHLICFSPTHSSHMIGETVLQGLGTGHVSETDLTYEKPEENLTIHSGITVIVVPVYGGRIAETALERMEGIYGQDSPAVAVVVYGNRDYDDALLELRDWCVAHGFVPVAGAAFIGEHSYSRPDRPIAGGRPDNPDLQKARAFGEQVGRLLNRFQTLDEVAPIVVKGNFPYKVKGPKTPQTPETVAELCTQCGFCIGICPVQAIRLEEEIVSDAGRCIKCCACVKQCPNEARLFETPYTDLLFKNFSTRREPEIFL